MICTRRRTFSIFIWGLIFCSLAWFGLNQVQAQGLVKSKLRVGQTARKFDEYGDIGRNDERARLDNFAIQLQQESSARGYIISYGGQCGLNHEALIRANRAKGYLANARAIEARRIVAIDGGYRDELYTELYIVPAGAVPPSVTPTRQRRNVRIVRNVELCGRHNWSKGCEDCPPVQHRRRPKGRHRQT